MSHHCWAVVLGGMAPKYLPPGVLIYCGLVKCGHKLHLGPQTLAKLFAEQTEDYNQRHAKKQR